MGDIVIENEERALSTCNQILNYVRETSGSVDSLESALSKMSSAWDSTGTDKESYVGELEKQITNINTLMQHIKEIANTVIYHVNTAKETAAKTVESK